MTTARATELPQMVREAIEATGDTVLGVAKGSGVPRTTLINRLNGVRPFTAPELLAIARHLGVSASDWIRVVEDAA